MRFTKGAVAGFIFGTALTYAIGRTNVSRIPWMMRVVEEGRKTEGLTKKETMTWLNDQASELEILRAFAAMQSGNNRHAAEFFAHLNEIRMRAMTDPVFATLLAKIESAIDNN